MKSHILESRRPNKWQRLQAKLKRLRQKAKKASKPKLTNYVMWHNEPGACDICLINAAAGVVPEGTVFPSGDKEPPAHEHCRCSLETVERAEDFSKTFLPPGGSGNPNFGGGAGDYFGFPDGGNPNFGGGAGDYFGGSVDPDHDFDGQGDQFGGGAGGTFDVPFDTGGPTGDQFGGGAGGTFGKRKRKR